MARLTRKRRDMEREKERERNKGTVRPDSDSAAKVAYSVLEAEMGFIT